MRGPRAGVPAGGVEADDELPYAGEGPPRGRGRAVTAVVAAILLLGVVGAVVALSRGNGGSTPSADRRRAGRSESEARTSTTAAPASSSAPTRRATSAPATSAPVATTAATTAPVTTTAPLVPVEALPPHEAVYRDGTLFLQGTLPSTQVAERFRQEAAAVIGADHVVVQYQFDPRVPVPTDGHVRVDERFVFATGSAAVDPAYLQVFDLGVAVLKINPQATMRIRGYTDDVGGGEANLQLSRARAEAAAGYLEAHGIDRARLTVVGFGPADPVAPNDSDEHRAENRRIEVDLYNLLGA